MNQDIERLAREAGLSEYGVDVGNRFWDADDECIEAFARAVAAECIATYREYGLSTGAPDAIRAKFGVKP
jgi:hypothetical protein